MNPDGCVWIQGAGELASGGWLRVSGDVWVSEAFVKPVEPNSPAPTEQPTDSVIEPPLDTPTSTTTPPSTIIPPDTPVQTRTAAPPSRTPIPPDTPTTVATTTPTAIPPDTPTWTVTPAVTAPVIYSSSCIPTLNAPAPGQVLDNGRTDHTDNILWEFSWGGCQTLTYQLYVIGPNASIPLIDEVVNDTFYLHMSDGYVADHNLQGWRWNVSALIDGEWGDWSAARYFDVEPVNSD